MHCNVPARGFPRLLLVSLLAAGALPLASLAADDSEAERESRRIEFEARRLQEQGRRDMAERERNQAEALSMQQDAISRMEATQLRMQADAQQREQQQAEQARSSSYSLAPLYVPGTPVAPLAEAPMLPPVLPVAPAVPIAPLPVDRAPRDAVGRMSFATLTEQLQRYFGAQSGVLVVSAGAAFGLQDGDVIIAVDGRAPSDGPHAARILRSYQSGERVKLRVMRERRIIELDTVAPR